MATSAAIAAARQRIRVAREGDAGDPAERHREGGDGGNRRAVIARRGNEIATHASSLCAVADPEPANLGTMTG